jgi:hypothetical protein
MQRLLVKNSFDAAKRSEIALSKLYDSTVPILILLGNSKEEVLQLRSYLEGGDESSAKIKNKAETSKHAKAIGMFSDAWNKEIRVFCNAHGVST